MLEQNRYNGNVYGLPFAASNAVMYYNKDLFRQAGLDPEKPPATWDEVYEYSKKIKALGSDYYGFAIYPGKGWMGQAFTWQFGGSWIAKDNSTVLWTEREALDTLRFMKKMYDEGLSTYTNQASECQSLLLAGKLGIWCESSGNIISLRDAAGFELGVAVLPYKVKKVAPVGGAGVYMYSKSPQEKKDAAWEFLKFIVSRDNQLYLSINNGFVACSAAVVNSPEMKDYWKSEPRLSIPYIQLDYAVPQDQTKLTVFNEIKAIWIEGWDEIILKNGDIEKTMAAVQERANRVIAESRR
jgi:sn-glycerol 3-phosphate transport system substrate-binding protein